MEQLSMVHPAPASAGAPVAGEGIALRTFRNGEEQAWADIINATDLGADYGVAKVRETLTGKSRFDPEGLFLACDSATGRPLATACAWQSFVFGRSRPTLHMVAARPEASGRGLGKLVCRAVLDYFARRGEQEVVLTTDDHRLPAIATYLEVGLRPMRYVRGEDHAGRWKAILEKLSGGHGAGEFSGPGRPVKVAVLGLRRGADIAGYARGHAAGEVTAACDRDEQRRDEFCAVRGRRGRRRLRVPVGRRRRGGHSRQRLPGPRPRGDSGAGGGQGCPQRSDCLSHAGGRGRPG